MKRVWVAIVLLVIVAVLSGGSLWLQQRTTARLVDECNALLDTYEGGDLERCRRMAEDFSAHLEEEMRWFPFFLHHQRMEPIFQQAAALPHFISDEDAADFTAGVCSVRMQLEIMMDSEWPLLENVF